MGGTIAVIVGSVLRRSRSDVRLLVAAGAAAGLATAFNAPIAGGVFVLEELVNRFDPRTTLATVLASAAGFASAHLLLHPSAAADVHVPALADPTLAQSPLMLVVGVTSGLLGVAYNAAVTKGLRVADTSRWPVVARAALIGTVVGALGWIAPAVVGGGDNLTQQALLGRGTIAAVTWMLVLRFVLGVLSYAACTPGGLFAPMLVLATEMTSSTTLLAPMLGACAIAMLSANAFGSTPIDDQLTRRAVSAFKVNADAAR